MIIRPAKDEDIPAIVELLRLSLGESLMPKSEAFWRWKHIDNPFGRSNVLLAMENEKLIGVRAFMNWQWRFENKTYNAVRAVDTATHPHHVGQGIFRRLTLQLVEQSRSEGIAFIFNTPNKISMPGYLKMGWQSNGKMKIFARPVFSIGVKEKDFDARYKIGPNKIPFVDEFTWNNSLLSTANSVGFFNWRYGANPNVEYYVFSDNESKPSFLTIFRLKPYFGGTEFRICHTLGIVGENKAYKKQLLQVVGESGASLITSACKANIFPAFGLSIGPVITTRSLSFDHNYLTFNFWKPTLGDLEVF